MPIARAFSRRSCASPCPRRFAAQGLRISLSLLAVAVGGCTSGSTDGGVARMPPGAPSWLDVPGPRLADLPMQSEANVGYFKTAGACAQCHTTADGSTVLRDAAGRDVSPVTTWRPTMMALAARDPFYLATLSRELARGTAGDAIEAACTRCHAPAATIDLAASGKHVTFAALTSDGTSPDAALARDGVGCALCHEITAGGLGTPASFGGQLTVSGTTIYGQYQDPLVMPMQFYVSYTPAGGAHMTQSGLCGSCHTVITHALDAAGNPVGPAFYEQAAFLEWQDSRYATTKTCQACHVPTDDDDGVAITTAIARPPGTAVQPRTPFGRHTFAGANGYVLGLVADNAAALGVATPVADLTAQAARDEANAGAAAALTIVRAARDGGELVVAVQVENKAGHKLPTGYPSRRAFLHLVVRDAGGATVFESGAVDAYGRLLDGHGNLVDVPGELHPHLDLVTRDDQVQIWESVPADASGAVAARPLDAVGYLKDDRLLPEGYSASGPNAALTAPVGVDGDANFGSRDTVTYRVAAPAGALRVAVELQYQTLRPTDLDALAAQPTDASRRFFDMVAARAPGPVTLAHAETTVP